MNEVFSRVNCEANRTKYIGVPLIPTLTHLLMVHLTWCHYYFSETLFRVGLSIHLVYNLPIVKWKI